MSLWRQMRLGMRALMNRRSTDEDLNDELAHFLEQSRDSWNEKGLAPAEAARAARLEVGNVTAVREEVRSHGWENIAETFVNDVRYGARQLRNKPGFAAVIILTLALGVGALTAIYSAIKPILFEPLPYPNASRIVSLWDRGAEGVRLSGTFGTYRELVARSRSFEAMAAMSSWQPTLTGPVEPERIEGQRVSASYFRVFGIAPAMGRDFQESEDRLNGGEVVILSDKLWRRRFGADRSLAGRQITLDGNSYTVVGVMPAGFSSALAPGAEIWTPLHTTCRGTRPGGTICGWRGGCARASERPRPVRK